MSDSSKPIALIAHERLMPGAQLVNRIRELGYEPRTVGVLSNLAEAVRGGALFALVDLNWDHEDVMAALRQLRADAATAHLPVLAFSHGSTAVLNEVALAAGATLVAGGDSVVKQLPALIECLLHVD